MANIWGYIWNQVLTQSAVIEAFKTGTEADLRRAIEDNGLSQAERKYILNAAYTTGGNYPKIKAIIEGKKVQNKTECSPNCISADDAPAGNLGDGANWHAPSADPWTK